MKTDGNEFFREATLRICGSMEIEKALWQCLLYIGEHIPADHLGLHVYDYGLGIFETVAIAVLDGGRAMSLKTQLSPELQKKVLEEWSVGINSFDRLGDNELTRPVAQNLDARDLSGVTMELILEGEELGLLSVTNDGGKKFTEEHVRLLSLLNEPFAIALTNSLRYRELENLKNLLADDNRYLQGELRRYTGEEVIGSEFGLREVMEMVRQVATLDSPVLLLGETGTGKEVMASVIHNLSYRREGPFILVNCGAIPDTLLDSELFGHEKGAFTGALSRKRGRFERAHRGTIFLDEIGELPPGAQVRLLRVLQEKEIERVGGTGPIKVDIRVIAATHRDLEAMLGEGRFREDLYFRLKVFPIVIPPLRERRIDIPALAHHLIQKKARQMKLGTVPTLAPNVLDRLMAYRWPGNVRELENAVERALILSRGKSLTFDHLEAPLQRDRTSSPGPPDDESLNLDAAMAKHIRRALDVAGGKVEGKGGTAELLGVNPRTLRHRMRKLGVAFGRKARKA